MTKEFLDMIYLFSCGAKGVIPKTKHVIDAEKIREQAINHGVWLTVFISMKELYSENMLNIDKELFNKWNAEFMYTTALCYRRNYFVYNTINKLQKSGISCCLLKGESISRFYKVPVCRNSSDTDILIEISNEKKCRNLLKRLGYKVQPRFKGSHHFICTHPVGGVLEIHVSMCGDITNDICFDKKVELDEEYEKLLLEDGTIVNTLGITDGLIFLILHFTKHFLSFGVGVRQLYDILSYIDYYYEEIDLQRVYCLLKHLKFDKLFFSIIDIGYNYFDFDIGLTSDIRISQQTIQDILTDIEKGGVFGKQEKERKYFYEFYMKERFLSFRNGDFNEYIRENYSPKITERLFPDKDFMSVDFSYVEKSSLLLPVAWLHRVANAVIRSAEPKNSNSEGGSINEVVDRRMSLIRMLEMV